MPSIFVYNLPTMISDTTIRQALSFWFFQKLSGNVLLQSQTQITVQGIPVRMVEPATTQLELITVIVTSIGLETTVQMVKKLQM